MKTYQEPRFDTGQKSQAAAVYQLVLLYSPFPQLSETKQTTLQIMFANNIKLIVHIQTPIICCTFLKSLRNT